MNFASNCVLLQKSKIEKYYVVMFAKSILPGCLGRTIGVLWLSLFNSDTKEFSHNWSLDVQDCDFLQSHTIDLFNKKRNIERFPHLLYDEDSDKEACYHLRSLMWMNKIMTDNEFDLHKQQTITEVDRRRAIAAEEKKIVLAKQLEESLKIDQKLKDELNSSEAGASYESLRWKAGSYAYSGQHYRATLVKEHCNVTFPSEFIEEHFSNVLPICPVEGCRNALCWEHK